MLLAAVNETWSGLCSSAFWDTDLTWNSPHPEFTPCFERTLLVWLPSAFLWLLLPWEIHSLYHTRAFSIPFNRYNISKLVTIVIMGISILLDLTDYFFLDKKRATIHIYTLVIKFFSICLFFGLTYANMKCGVRSSGILFLFSLLLVICGAPQFLNELRTTFKNVASDSHRSSSNETFEFFSYSLYYSATLIGLVLNCYADISPETKTKLDNENESPEEESSVLSRVFFAWFDRFAWKGFQKPLTQDDLWDVHHTMKTAHVSKALESKWQRALRRLEKSDMEHRDATTSASASVWVPLWNVFGRTMMLGFLLKLSHSALTFSNPLMLKLIISFVGNENELLWHGYLYSFMLVVLGVLQTLFMNNYANMMMRLGLQMRTAIISLIYKKALKISNGARKDYALGEVVNLMSVDAERFIQFVYFLFIIAVTPIEICTAIALLWVRLGSCVVVGLIVWIILMPVNYVTAKKYHQNVAKLMKRKDERGKLTSEILSGIKVLKLNAWEPCFEKQVIGTFKKEIGITRRNAYLESFAWFFWTGAPLLVTLVTFAAYVLSDEGNVLNAETVFVSLTLLNILRTAVLGLPGGLAYLAQTNIAIRRINKFLNAEELDSNAVSHDERVETVIIENGQFSWDGYAGLPTLSDINLRVEPGSLVAIVGRVGSGKTSLLSAILGEMYKQSGFVNTTGTLAYVPQQAWLRNTTLKENITFGRSGKRSVYEQTVKACALDEDLKILPARDRTEIGEKGINLSGGQKQRISLARAVYSDADTYLLDDPLSAVDSHVGKHIFEHVIGPNGLLQKKTRIWVTHNLTYLSQVDLIVVLQDGVISESGTLNELMKKSADFARVLTSYQDEKTIDTDDDVVKEIPTTESNLQDIDDGLVEDFRVRSTSTASSASDVKSEAAGERLIEEEKAKTGNINWSACVYYLRAVGLYLVILILIINVLVQVFLVASNYWLAVWSSDTSTATRNNTNEYVQTQYMYLGVYGVLGMLQAMSISFHAVVLYLSAFKAATYMHSRLLTSVLHWRATAFDKIPLGRIINRFGSDIEILENQLPVNLWQTFLQTATVMSTLFVISYTTPPFLFVLPPLGILFYLIERFYTATSRQLKRMDLLSKSPVYSHMNETVSGVQSIRAYSLQSMFVEKLEDKVDFNLKSSYANLTAERWLALRLELLGTSISFFSTLFVVLRKRTLSAELAGLSLAFAMQVTNSLYTWTRMISETETNAVAIERVKEYVNSDEEEAAWTSPNENVPKDWPSEGEVEFENLEARYREGMEPVLKGISFGVKSGERVGIVGRTGAGKSSLTLCLFRMIEPTNGKIRIDGVDISKIGLHTLRERLNIIPQDPVLFSGTVRLNVDPTNKYSDDCVWRALEEANLKSFVSSLKFGLQSEIEEGGSNLSVGQRQLICLARAVLRKTKVLVLDEATAAVDIKTDELIQNTIRKTFPDSTVLTIAHRLNTVLDYDRIIVLDQGRIVEFDSPTALLELKDSIFYNMASDAGLVLANQVFDSSGKV